MASSSSRVSGPLGEEFQVHPYSIVITSALGGTRNAPLSGKPDALLRPFRYLFCHEEVTHSDAPIEVAKEGRLSRFSHFVIFDCQRAVVLRFASNIPHTPTPTSQLHDD